MGVQYHPTSEDVRSWMKMTDTNGDGKVSLEEYEDLVIRSLQHAGIKLD
jgi:Ca2+-binding EF-hand superfamily protein